MTQRTIILSNMTINRKISETGQLVLYTFLWNDGTEIPPDWHEDHTVMGLSIEFGIKEVIDDLVMECQVLHPPNNDGVWLFAEEKPIVDLLKEELQRGLDRLNKIQFCEEEEEE